MDIKALANRKVFGVPVYVIAFVVVIGLAYMAFRLRPTPDTPTDAAATDSGPEGDQADTGGDASPSDYQPPVFYADKVGPVSLGSSDVSTNGDTNAAWGQRAVAWLVTQGIDYGLAAHAISKYLEGSNLTFEEGAARDQAIKQFGIPPEPLSVGGVGGYKGPAVRQGVPPTTHHVKGKSDDSAPELARLYYGIADRNAVSLIRAENASVVEPYAVGSAIRIPRNRQPKYYRATGHIRSLYAIARKNGTTPAEVSRLNPQIKRFPVKPGTRVRVA